LHFNLSYFNLN